MLSSTPRFPLVLIALVAAGLLSVSLAFAAAVEGHKGKTRPLLTKQLMAGLMKVHCGALKKGTEAAPASDEAWAELAINAALINEASYVLMADDRCPDATWAKAAAEELRAGSDAVLKAVAAKNHEELKKTFGELTKACGTCHKAHKK